MKKIKELIVLCCTVLSFSVFAENTQFIVHHAAGGPADIFARLTSVHINNKNYFVVNRPGGRGLPAILHLKDSESIMLASTVQIFVTNQLILKDKLNYDAGNDLEIIAVLGLIPNVVVCNNNKFKDFEELLQSTQSLNFAVGSPGGAEHLSTLLLLSQ